MNLAQGKGKIFNMIRKRPIRLFVALMTGILLVAACENRGGRNRGGNPPEAETKVAPAVPVEVVAVKKGELAQRVTGVGNITPEREAHIGSKLSGRIEEIYCREGDMVNKGDVLIKLEQKNHLLAVTGAEAQLLMAQATHTEAKVNLENVAREKERLNRLYEKSAISQQRNDDINSAYLLAGIKVELAQANLTGAVTGLASAREQLQDTLIRAPFAGIVVRRSANSGEMIAAGIPIISLVAIDRVKLEVDVLEMKITQVKQGLEGDVTVDALGSGIFKGKISGINPRINPLNRTFRIEIAIANDGHLLKPGMFARLTIKTETLKNVLIIPAKAILEETKGSGYVLLVKDNRALKRSVKIGLSDENLVEIKDGLTPGDLVIVAGNYGMEEGTAVSFRQVPY